MQWSYRVLLIFQRNIGKNLQDQLITTEYYSSQYFCLVRQAEAIMALWSKELQWML